MLIVVNRGSNILRTDKNSTRELQNSDATL